MKHDFELSTLNNQLIRVAIVDDHKVVAEGFERLVNESENAQVIGKAFSIAECWELLEMAQPDVILLDISLPDGNGINLCRQIKKKYPQIRILMLTSYNEPFTISSALEAGSDGYVLKNAMAEEVLEGIRTIAAGKRFLCDEAETTLGANENRSMELTRRETELLQLIAEGLALQQLADKMFLSIETIRSYRKTLNIKLGAHNTAQLLQKAKELKLL
jgi:DNA-binding NarL/FixJ family response regulator